MNKIKRVYKFKVGDRVYAIKPLNGQYDCCNLWSSLKEVGLHTKPLYVIELVKERERYEIDRDKNCGINECRNYSCGKCIKKAKESFDKRLTKWLK